MDRSQILERLREAQSEPDTELAHIWADTALLEAVDDPEIKEEYEKVGKWYA